MDWLEICRGPANHKVADPLLEKIDIAFVNSNFLDHSKICDRPKNADVKRFEIIQIILVANQPCDLIGVFFHMVASQAPTQDLRLANVKWLLLAPEEVHAACTWYIAVYGEAIRPRTSFSLAITRMYSTITDISMSSNRVAPRRWRLHSGRTADIFNQVVVEMIHGTMDDPNQKRSQL